MCVSSATSLGFRGTVRAISRFGDDVCSDVDTLQSGVSWTAKVLSAVDLLGASESGEGGLGNLTTMLGTAAVVMGVFTILVGIKMLEDGCEDIYENVQKLKVESRSTKEKVLKWSYLGSAVLKTAKGADLIVLGAAGNVSLIQTLFSITSVAMNVISKCIIPIVLVLNSITIVKDVVDITCEVLRPKGDDELSYRKGVKISLKLVEIAEKVIGIALLILIISGVVPSSPWVFISIGLATASLGFGRKFCDKALDAISEARDAQLKREKKALGLVQLWVPAADIT